MAYIFQSWTINQVLTAAAISQTEVNVRDHAHGLSGVSTPILLRNNTPVTVSNVSVETALISGTVPAGTLSTDKFLRFRAFGSYLNNTGVTRTLTFFVKYGGTTLSSYGRTDTANATRTAWELEGWIASSGATNSQASQVGMKFASAGTGVTTEAGGTQQENFRVNDSIPVDSNVVQTFLISVTPSVADVNLSVTLEGFYLEAVR